MGKAHKSKMISELMKKNGIENQKMEESA